MAILNTLPVNRLIQDVLKTKDFYRYNCPDFDLDARYHFSWLEQCRLTKFGALGSLNGKNFYFGLYSFSKGFDYYPNQGIVIFEEHNIGKNYIKPIIFRAHLDIFPKHPRLGYSEPHIFNTKFGQILEISCALGGVSSIGYDLKYFLWNSSKWFLLDSESWMDELQNRLPKGLSIWNEEPIDLNNLTYTSDLWKETDAHCCPTGGKLKVYLKIEQDRFAISSFTISN